jgi:hypothetical protein
MDEVVQISKRTRNSDLQSAGVILDFKTQQVLKCSVNGQVGDRDWTRVRDFYNQHYPEIVSQLEKVNEKQDNPG